MRIQQAIFTSSDRGRIKGYQLVAKSANIEDAIARQLHRWSPSQLDSDDAGMWTINCFPVNADSVAVARTLLGGPEYSNRGGSQVVTVTAVLHNDQFAAYENNAMWVVQSAMALGWLRLPSDIHNPCLSEIELPDHPLADDAEYPASRETDVGEHARTCNTLRGVLASEVSRSDCLAKIVELVIQGRRLVIIGANSPREMVSELIQRLSIHKRRAFSFTTGLVPAIDRPFQVHFLPDSHPVLERMLSSQGITILKLPQIAADPQKLGA